MKFRQYASKLIKLTLKFSKKFYVFSILRALMLSIKAFVGVYGLSLIIQGLVSNSIETAIMYAAILVGVEMIIKFLEIILFSKINYERDVVFYGLKTYVINKLMNVEYQKLEDPEFLETTTKSRFAIDNFAALYRFLDRVMDITSNFIIVVSLIGVIIYFNAIILAIIVLSIVIQSFISKGLSKMQTNIVNELGPLNRKLNYFTNVVEDSRYQKDFRLYENTGRLIYDKMNEFLYKTNAFLHRFQRVGGKYQMYIGMINYIQITAMYLIIGYISISQGLGVATYIFLTASAMRANTAINAFAGALFGMRESLQVLRPTFELLDTEESVDLFKDGQKCTKFKSLTFENVSFTYPGTEKEILTDVSFTINNGEKVSIVGLNGAGKTTIVKLINRFYKPNKGKIYWNGVDIYDYEYDSYINEISAVFQDFKLFALTLSENVDLEQKDLKYIKECIDSVGLEKKVDSLPKKEMSYLSKEYDEEGIDLSGGEKQKLAIARAMYKNSSLAILDEPTSALDPLSEAEIYENFSELVKDKTTIYISHRMSSSIFCDKIIVLNDGQISDIDTHANLMKNKKSMYFELFNAQSNYYV